MVVEGFRDFRALKRKGGSGRRGGGPVAKDEARDALAGDNVVTTPLPSFSYMIFSSTFDTSAFYIPGGFKGSRLAFISAASSRPYPP